MTLKPTSLTEFLGRLNVSGEQSLPWTHTTESARIFDILNDGHLAAIPCNVFRDNLCYFFVGRPAYKTSAHDSPEFWQLPLTFVMRFSDAPRIKRVFPFDSGAFAAKRLPSFMTTFPLSRYELNSDKEQIGRLISFFFQTPARYLDRRAVGHEDLKEQFNLDARHQEILALSRLYLEHSSASCDDRAAAVEIQVDEDVPLRSDNLLGVVVPSEYARVPEILRSLKVITRHVETYDILPLNSAAYHGVTYEAVRRIYKAHGIGR
jgi:hypothetical protein